MSDCGPEKIGPSDWSRCEWGVLREELEATRVLAQQLKLWTVIGAVHPLSGPLRPHNSLHIISDQGVLATRYDERLLSNTKISFMYTPGSIPIVFEVDGVRFGCALGMEAHYPEIFGEYERLDVDCVLFSTTGGSSSDATFGAELLGHAASNTYWVSFSVHAQPGLQAPAGIAGPDGQWATQCQKDGAPSIAVSSVGNSPESSARPWRRLVRASIHKSDQTDSDPRSNGRDMF